MHRLSLLLALLMLLVFGSSQKTADAPGVLLWKEARMHFDSAKYDLALQRGQQALEATPKGALEAGDCLLLLGDVFLETGQWDAALQQYQAASTIFIQQLGPRHLHSAAVYNRMGEFFYKKEDYSQAIAFYQQALQIRELALGPWHELVADGYNNLGNCQVGHGHYAAAEVLHQKALSIRQRALPEGHPDLATSFNNLGNCAYLSGNYTGAVAYFDKALAVRQQVFGADHPKTAQVLNNLGNACAGLGLRNKAVAYYRQALEIRRRAFGDRHPTVASAIENIADLYFDNGDYIAALDFFRQAYSIQSKVQGATSASAASLWHSIGLCYQYEGDYDRALVHHLDAEPLLIGALGRAHPLVGKLYNNLGNCYLGKKDFANALLAFQKALTVFQQARPAPSGSIALVYNNIGLVYLGQRQAMQAMNYFQKALAAGEQEPPGERALFLKNKGLALEQLHRWPEARSLFEQAMAMANGADPTTEHTVLDAWATLLCQRGLRTRDAHMLQQSVAVFEQSQSQSDSLWGLLDNPGSRQRWLELQFPALACAIEACYGLWQQTGDMGLLEKAFALSERYKSIQLLEHLHQEQAEQLAGIPDSLIEQERFWKETLNRREKGLLTIQKSEHSTSARTAEMGVAEARQALSALKQQLEQLYPDYHRLQYHRQTTSLADIRLQVLQKGQALIEYFVADSAVFVFVVTAADFRVLRLARNFPLNELIAGLRHSLQAYPAATGRGAEALDESFVDQAFQLYQAILSPVQQSIQLPEKLMIVPDATLAYLPFECLLRERPADAHQFKSHHYLLRDFCISYAYSATQQRALLQTKSRPLSNNLLAVAPVYARNQYGLQPLQNNRAEARAAADLFQGKVLEGPNATVPAFLQEAGQYHILLLAMHGKASSTVGDMSYIAFSTSTDSTENPFLYARDLYHQSMPADLVVLSACETSVGAYRYGQGVISLAKGFFQAGARSVAATLWSVDDARNAELMRLFFSAIKAGATKDDALRQAKLSFLLAHPHDEANPVYWAAVTVYGDMAPVALEGWGGWWWIVGMGVAGLVLWAMVRRFIRSRLELLF